MVCYRISNDLNRLASLVLVGLLCVCVSVNQTVPANLLSSCMVEVENCEVDSRADLADKEFEDLEGHHRAPRLRLHLTSNKVTGSTRAFRTIVVPAVHRSIYIAGSPSKPLSLRC